MKQTIQMQKIQESLKPGRFSREGFLGKDSRNLIDILVEDDAEVKRLGCEHETIAMRMLYFRNMGENALGEYVDIPPHFSVSVNTVRGKLPCPFECRKIITKCNISVKNNRTGKEITYTDMHIHMILCHGFYQGKGSLYRLGPGLLIDVLEIPKEVC